MKLEYVGDLDIQGLGLEGPASPSRQWLVQGQGLFPFLIFGKFCLLIAMT